MKTVGGAYIPWSAKIIFHIYNNISIIKFWNRYPVEVWKSHKVYTDQTVYNKVHSKPIITLLLYCDGCARSKMLFIHGPRIRQFHKKTREIFRCIFAPESASKNCLTDIQLYQIYLHQAVICSLLLNQTDFLQYILKTFLCSSLSLCFFTTMISSTKSFTTFSSIFTFSHSLNHYFFDDSHLKLKLSTFTHCFIQTLCFSFDTERQSKNYSSKIFFLYLPPIKHCLS